MLFFKRHLSIILIVLLTVMAIALVTWVFDKKLRHLEVKQKTTFYLLPK
jgi:hypothetical protein